MMVQETLFGQDQVVTKKAKPKPAVAQTYDYFIERWKNKFGQNYPSCKSKEFVMIQWMIDRCNGDLSIMKKIIDTYFQNSEKFTVNSGYAISNLRYQFTSFYVKIACKPKPLSQAGIWMNGKKIA